MQAFSYIRFSSPQQANKGRSLDRQLERSGAIARKHGATLSDLTFRDLGISGFRGKHVEQGRLGAFLQAIADGHVKAGDILIVENLDRLSRQELDDARELVRRILLAGVKIATHASEHVFTKASLSDPMQLMIMLIDLSRAHGESVRKKDLVTASWRQRFKAAAKGADCQSINVGVLPAWLKRESGSVTPLPHAVKSINLIFQLSCKGYGTPQIVRKLNQDNVKPIGTCKHWTRSYVTVLLRDRRLIGEYQPKALDDETGKYVPYGEAIENFYPAILDKALFVRSNQLTTARIKHKGRQSTKVTNLFSGLIIDARTQTKMVLQYQLRHYYQSQAARHGLGQCPIVRVSTVEDTILSSLVSLRLERLFPSKGGGELEKLKADLADCEARINETERRAEKAKNFQSLLNLLEKLETKKAQLKQDIEQATIADSHPMRATYRQIAELVEARAGDVETRTTLRNHLRTVIERIWCLTFKGAHKKQNFAILQIEFVGGEKTILLTPNNPTGLEYVPLTDTWIVKGKHPLHAIIDLDLADFPQWAEKYQAVVW